MDVSNDCFERHLYGIINLPWMTMSLKMHESKSKSDDVYIPLEGSDSAKNCNGTRDQVIKLCAGINIDR